MGKLVTQIGFLVNLQINLWRHCFRALHFCMAVLKEQCIYVMFLDYFTVVVSLRDHIHCLYKTVVLGLSLSLSWEAYNHRSGFCKGLNIGIASLVKSDLD